MDAKSGAKTGSATAVADVRRVPLERLSASTGSVTRRIIPPVETPRAPVATFDAAL